jgi:4-hydroxybenzoate polyprenyltransferase
VNRWIVYQRERFPVLAHASLVAAFSVSAVCFSSLVRGRIAPSSIWPLIVAFVTCLLFFLQLRIADEFKDYEEDKRYRPYRPVPRGVVTLRELGAVATGAALVQLALAVALEPSLVWLLLIVWGYLALMTCEFFAGPWLERRPLAYMASHMMILPLIDLYATACDWKVAGLSRPPDGLFWFLVVSFLNGVVVEIGRKTRVPDDEEPGVETYSALWGLDGALRVWLTAIVLTGAAAWRAAERIGTATPTLLLLLALAAACFAGTSRLRRSVPRGSGRVVETLSGVWTLVMYLGLGALPALLTHVSSLGDGWRTAARVIFRRPVF